MEQTKETFGIDEENANKTDEGITKFAFQRNKIPENPAQ